MTTPPLPSRGVASVKMEAMNCLISARTAVLEALQSGVAALNSFLREGCKDASQLQRPATQVAIAYAAIALARARDALCLLPLVPALAVLMETLKLSLGSGALSSVSAMETVFWVSPAAKVRVWLTPV